MKKTISDLLRDYNQKGILNLRENKNSTLVDFVTCFPSILAKVATCKGIKTGFLANGMLDTKTETWPDFDAIMQTCKKRSLLTKENIAIVTNNFKELYLHMVNEGHITDEAFEKFKFTQGC